MRIKDNAFIVTGAASGLGEATALRLAEGGARVVAADMHDEAAERLVSRLGPKSRFVKCDVTVEDDGRAAVSAATALGALRGLINCAGITIGERTVGKDGPHRLDTFLRVIEVNLAGSFNMIRLAAAAMSELPAQTDGERGVVVNTASIAAFDGQIGQAAYAASKAGIVGMTLPIARDLARVGIRCVTIAPGLFGTPMLLGMPKLVQDALAGQVPFPTRLGQPAEYAQLVEAIIGNVMLNGETIRLDGAIRMQPK